MFTLYSLIRPTGLYTQPFQFLKHMLFFFFKADDSVDSAEGNSSRKISLVNEFFVWSFVCLKLVNQLTEISRFHNKEKI